MIALLRPPGDARNIETSEYDCNHTPKSRFISPLVPERSKREGELEGV